MIILFFSGCNSYFNLISLKQVLVITFHNKDKLSNVNKIFTIHWPKMFPWLELILEESVVPFFPVICNIFWAPSHNHSPGVNRFFLSYVNSFKSCSSLEAISFSSGILICIHLKLHLQRTAYFSGFLFLKILFIYF